MNSIKDRAFKNISYSLLSFGWPIVIALFVTPLFVHHFGIKEYGIYIFINTLITLAGLLDLGVSTAISKFIAEQHGNQNKVGVKSLFETANSVFLFIGIIGAFFISSSIFLGLVSFPGEITSSYQAYIPAFIYAGIIFLLNSLSSLYVIIPTAYQRFDIGSKIGITFITIQQLTLLGVIFLHKSINTLFLVQVILTAVFYFVYRKYTKTILSVYENEHVGKYGWDKNEAIKIYKFGFASFLNNLAGSSLTYLDRMIIPMFIGPSNLTFYSLPGSITNKIPNLSATLSSIVFPMTAYFEGEGNRDMTKNLYIRSMRLITVISTAMAVSFVAFAYQMLQYWIGVNLADKATGVLIILAFTNLILAITYPLNNFLLGMGKLKLMSITSVLTAILNAILLIILLPKFGIIGAAWAYLLALLPYVYLIYETERSYLKLTLRRAHYIKLISQLSLTSAIVFLLDIYFIKPFITNFFLVLLSLGISCIIFIFIHYLFGFFEKEDSHDILNFGKNVLLKLRKR